MGYGAGGSGSKIPGGATLVFELEVIEVREASWRDWLTLQTGVISCVILFQLYQWFGDSGTKHKTVTLEEAKNENNPKVFFDIAIDGKVHFFSIFSFAHFSLFDQFTRRPVASHLASSNPFALKPWKIFVPCALAKEVFLL